MNREISMLTREEPLLSLPPFANVISGFYLSAILDEITKMPSSDVNRGRTTKRECVTPLAGYQSHGSALHYTLHL